MVRVLNKIGEKLVQVLITLAMIIIILFILIAFLIRGLIVYWKNRVNAPIREKEFAIKVDPKNKIVDLDEYRKKKSGKY